MAGGPDTPALAAAVTNAGGLGSLGCAYLTAAQIDAQVAAARALTSGPYAINLFMRGPEPDDAAARARVAPLLDEFRRELGLPPPGAPKATPPLGEQLEAVLRAAPAVFSFTFGMPTREMLAALRARAIASVGTATTVDEAEALAELGVDAVCAQGAEAGGHRGTFLGRFEDALVGTMALVPAVVARVGSLPVIAAGGIMDGRGVRAALSLGAAAAQLGTAFMDCPEAGTPAPHRAALRSARARRTVVTRGFSGRAARGMRNRFTDAFERVEAGPFPEQQLDTADIRAAAIEVGEIELMQMWAGQGAPLLRALPAGELVETLAREAGLA
jgi:nitronate monooxygenase